MGKQKVSPAACLMAAASRLTGKLFAKTGLKPCKTAAGSRPIPQLAGLSHLRLVDMPGWDSGIQAHSVAIDNYASRSLAYGVVVSADEGNLRDSIRKALKELAVRDIPVFAIVSKADKKPPEDVDAVVEQVKQEITHTMGKPPFKDLKVRPNRFLPKILPSPLPTDWKTSTAISAPCSTATI